MAPVSLVPPTLTASVLSFESASASTPETPAEPPPPPIACTSMPCAPEPSVSIVPVLVIVTVPELSILEPSVPPRRIEMLPLSVEKPAAAEMPPVPPPPPIDCATIACDIPPLVAIVPAFVTMTFAPTPPAPPAPPRLRFISVPCASEPATLKPPLPPPPPIDCARMPFESKPVVTMMPLALPMLLFTVTRPALPPTPPLPPRPTVNAAAAADRLRDHAVGERAGRADAAAVLNRYCRGVSAAAAVATDRYRERIRLRERTRDAKAAVAAAAADRLRDHARCMQTGRRNLSEILNVDRRCVTGR